MSRRGLVMELVILKARTQLNRLVLLGERRSGREADEGGGGRGGAGGGGGEVAPAAGRGRERSAPAGMAPAPPAQSPLSAPASTAPWLNTTFAFATHLNATFDTDYELLNASTSDEHNNHWFCAKWTSAQQDLFQVTNYILL